jgi:O-antigen/teichoic acid export membrane protein
MARQSDRVRLDAEAATMHQVGNAEVNVPPMTTAASEGDHIATDGSRQSPSVAAASSGTRVVPRIRHLMTTHVGRLHRDSLVRNSFFIMLTTIINSIFGFAFWLVAARTFPAHVVGLTAALIAASTIAILLASLGVGGTLIQSLPTKKDPGAWSLTFWAGMATALVLSLAIGGVILILLPAFTAEFDTLRNPTYAFLLLFGTVALTVGTVIDYVFIAERSAGNMVVRNLVLSAGKVLLVVGLTVLAGSSGQALLGSWAASSLVGLCCGVVLLVRRAHPRRPPRLVAVVNAAIGLRGRLAGNQLIGMGASLLPFVLPLLVTSRLSPTENAYFYTTWMMAGVFLIISPAVSQALFAEGAHSPHELLSKGRNALGVIGAILLPCIVGIIVLGGPLLSAFGAAYEEHAAGLLRIVVIASIPDAVSNVYVAIMRVQGRLVTAACLNMGMGFGIIVFSWLCLPTMGIDAVGWGFLIVQLCGCVYVAVDLFWWSRRKGALAPNAAGSAF